MTKKVAWVRDAQKEFRKFPVTVQRRMALALALALAAAAADGETADLAKPMKGLGSGVFEIVLAYRAEPIEPSMR